MQNDNLNDPIFQAFESGGVFAYPTEAVMGLGCDPRNEEAVRKLLVLKSRPVEKGLILIAKDYSQVLSYVSDQDIPMDRRADIFSSWPGPVTWLLPKSGNTPDWISGSSALVAVRISAHPVVRALCDRLDSALVSTSANVAGEPAARNLAEAKSIFGNHITYAEGEVGGDINPSIIRNGMTGELIRAG